MVLVAPDLEATVVTFIGILATLLLLYFVHTALIMTQTFQNYVLVMALAAQELVYVMMDMVSSSDRTAKALSSLVCIHRGTGVF